MVRFGLDSTELHIAEQAEDAGCLGEIVQRLTERRRQPFVTDNGNFILDCAFGAIPEPEILADALGVIPGVVEHGLFLGLADMAILAGAGGIEVIGPVGEDARTSGNTCNGRCTTRSGAAEGQSGMASHDYDLFVIGAGSGGVRAARIAAGHGAKVGIAEEYRVGGTCVIRGCVPKKLLVYASRFRDEFEDAAGFGWRSGPTTFDWRDADRQQGQGDRAARGLYKANLERAGVEIHRDPRGARGSQQRAARSDWPDGHRRQDPDRDRRLADAGASAGGSDPGHRARHHLERGVPPRASSRAAS